MRILILKISLFIIHIIAYPLHSQPIYQSIENANYLYKVQYLDSAYHNYQSFFDSTNSYSRQMLYKMAYIAGKKEELPYQLFYLSTLYRHQPNQKTLRKIAEISSSNNLEGYSYSDIEYFIAIYKQQYDNILIALVSGSFLYVLYLVYLKYNKNKVGIRPLLFIAFLFFLFIISNYSLIPPRAIIKNNYSLMMDEPSAASKVMNISDKGHRITLLGKIDIWYLISWNNKRFYMKETDLLIIPESQPYLF